MNDMQQKEFSELKDNVIGLKSDLHLIKNHLLGNEDLKDDGYLSRMEMKVMLQQQQIDNLQSSINALNKFIDRFNSISTFTKGAFYFFVAFVGIIGTVIAIASGIKLIMGK
jgi:ABC-type antimicrobial peptide transport system permease subunit